MLDLSGLRLLEETLVHADVAAGSASLSLDGRNALLGLLLAYGAWKASQYS